MNDFTIPYQVKRQITIITCSIAIVFCIVMIAISSQIVNAELRKQATTEDDDDIWKEEFWKLTIIFSVGGIFHAFLLFGAWRETDYTDKMLFDVLQLVNDGGGTVEG